MGNTNDNLRDWLENEIDNLRVKENAVRHAFLQNGDYLWIQLGGPAKAVKIKEQARQQRLVLMDLYEEMFDEEYLPRAFNELY